MSEFVFGRLLFLQSIRSTEQAACIRSMHSFLVAKQIFMRVGDKLDSIPIVHEMLDNYPSNVQNYVDVPFLLTGPRFSDVSTELFEAERFYLNSLQDLPILTAINVLVEKGFDNSLHAMELAFSYGFSSLNEFSFISVRRSEIVRYLLFADIDPQEIPSLWITVENDM